MTISKAAQPPGRHDQAQRQPPPALRCLAIAQEWPVAQMVVSFFVLGLLCWQGPTRQLGDQVPGAPALHRAIGISMPVAASLGRWVIVVDAAVVLSTVAQRGGGGAHPAEADLPVAGYSLAMRSTSSSLRATGCPAAHAGAFGERVGVFLARRPLAALRGAVNKSGRCWMYVMGLSAAVLFPGIASARHMVLA